MAINARENMVRTSAYLPKSYKKWLDDKSNETGLTISNLIVIALKTYIDQQNYLELLPELNERLKELNIIPEQPAAIELSNVKKSDVDNIERDGVSLLD